MGKCKLAPPPPFLSSSSISLSFSLPLSTSLSVCLSLRLPHHPPQTTSSPPAAPSPTLFNVVEGLHFYVLFFQVERAWVRAHACLCVYIAGGGPLCVPLQISCSKRGKHGSINKCFRLTAPTVGTCHSGGISTTDLGWVEGCLSRVQNSHQQTLWRRVLMTKKGSAKKKTSFEDAGKRRRGSFGSTALESANRSWKVLFRALLLPPPRASCQG